MSPLYTHSFRRAWDTFECRADICVASSDTTASLRSYTATANNKLTRSVWKMLGPFATASRRTPIHQVSLLTPPAHRRPRRRRQRQRQRQRVTEGTAMAPWNRPNQPTDQRSTSSPVNEMVSSATRNIYVRSSSVLYIWSWNTLSSELRDPSILLDCLGIYWKRTCISVKFGFCVATGAFVTIYR